MFFMFASWKKKRVYLDIASATPVHKAVQKAMAPYFRTNFGNAGSVHYEGQIAHYAIENARQTLARVLRIRSSGIVFTGSGTESNNLAIFGAIQARNKEGIAYTDMEIISTAIEHASVLEALACVASWGVKIIYAPLNEFGTIDIKAFTQHISTKTIFVTFAYANSEIGVVQPVAKLARIVRSHEVKHNTRIYVHIDGAQAPLWLPCALDALLVDIVSLDAGKCNGPKGVGVLAMRHGVSLASHMYGGLQEGGLRPGTENTPLIVGAVKALVMAQDTHQTRSALVAKQRDMFMRMLTETIEGTQVNGSVEERIANNVNVSISGIDAEFAVISLDEAGIACSTKSACGGARGDGSSVILTLTGDATRATSTIRFSLGEGTTLRELSYVTKVLKKHVETTRQAMQKLTSR